MRALAGSFKHPPAIGLLQFSRAGGCGSKVCQSDLQAILKPLAEQDAFDFVRVDLTTSDDAAVVSLSEDRVGVFTIDIMTPVCDDPRNFGAIAAANALSDIYAMGARPVVAQSFLAYPDRAVAAEVPSEILRGARDTCRQVQVPIIGGHTVRNPQVLFGLAVYGEAAPDRIKRNNTGRDGDALVLTKALGVGILVHMARVGRLDHHEIQALNRHMARLNREGTWLGENPHIHALTDVTGFGLVGHLREMLAGSGLSGWIDYDRLPVLAGAERGIPELDASWLDTPDIDDVRFDGDWTLRERTVVTDPQTNGGLLAAVDPDHAGTIVRELREHHGATDAAVIGTLTRRESGAPLIVLTD